MTLGARLAQPGSLWISFILTIIITAAFVVLQTMFDVVLIDGISKPAAVNEVLAAMSEQDRVIHVWITATLDVAYPLAYGALFIGSAYCFFPLRGFLLALPGMICIPVDLIEGVIQIVTLLHVADLAALKAFVTPLKSLLFIAGLLITIAGWLSWLVARIKSTQLETTED